MGNLKKILQTQNFMQHFIEKKFYEVIIIFQNNYNYVILLEEIILYNNLDNFL